MMTKLLRTQKSRYKNKLDKKRCIFLKDDPVLVISGRHKKKVTKVLAPRGDYCMVDLPRENQSYLAKAIERNRVKQLAYKIHVSNLQHYDTVNKAGSRVSYYYQKQTSEFDKNKINKIRIRKYIKTGREEVLSLTKTVKEASSQPSEDQPQEQGQTKSEGQPKDKQADNQAQSSTPQDTDPNASSK